MIWRLKKIKGGFTLIELLVVVLIIGILAAVAVPQYQKAVWKARFSEGTVLRDSIRKAMHAYALDHAHAQSRSEISATELDITVPLTTDYWEFEIWDEKTQWSLQGNFYSDKEHNNLILMMGEDPFEDGGFCYYDAETSMGKFLCEQTKQWGYDDIEDL